MFRKRKRREADDRAQRIRNAALRSAWRLVLIIDFLAGVVLLGGDSVCESVVGTVKFGRPDYWTRALLECDHRHHQGSSITGHWLGAIRGCLHSLRLTHGLYRLSKRTTTTCMSYQTAEL